jgi:hypothetical protein
MPLSNYIRSRRRRNRSRSGNLLKGFSGQLIDERSNASGLHLRLTTARITPVGEDGGAA